MARRADGAEIATSAKSLRSPTRPSAKLQLPCTYERAAPDVCANSAQLQAMPRPASIVNAPRSACHGE